MYKHIALIALLLPFSCYTITKQQRMQEIIAEVKSLENQMHYLEELIKHNAWMIYISGDAIRKSAVDAEEKFALLNKEYCQLELEIKQEQECSKK